MFSYPVRGTTSSQSVVPCRPPGKMLPVVLLFVCLFLASPSAHAQRFECGEVGTRCVGHISGFVRDVVSYEECAFRCRWEVRNRAWPFCMLPFRRRKMLPFPA